MAGSSPVDMAVENRNSTEVVGHGVNLLMKDFTHRQDQLVSKEEENRHNNVKGQDDATQLLDNNHGDFAVLPSSRNCDKKERTYQDKMSCTPLPAAHFLGFSRVTTTTSTDEQESCAADYDVINRSHGHRAAL